MRRKTLFGTLLSTFSCMFIFVSACQTMQMNGKELLDRAIAEMGKPTKLDAMNSMIMESRGTYMGVPFRSKVIASFPDLFRWEVKAQGDHHVMVTTGNECWQGLDGTTGELPGSHKESLQEHARVVALSKLVPLINGLDVEVIPGSSSERILQVMFRDDGSIFDLRFDESYRLSEVSGRDVNMGEILGRGELVVRYSDYKRVEGILTPFQSVLVFNGEPLLEERITSVRYGDPAVRPLLFDRPDGKQGAPRLKDRPETPVVFLQHRGSYQNFSTSLDKLNKLMEQWSAFPAGSPIFIYLNSPHEVSEEDLVTDICFPAAFTREINRAEEGGVVAKEDGFQVIECSSGERGVRIIPKQRVISITYAGEPSQRFSVYPLLYKWIAEKGYEVSGPPMHIDYSQPEASVSSAFVQVQLPVQVMAD